MARNQNRTGDGAIENPITSSIKSQRNLPIKASVVWKRDRSVAQCPLCASHFGFLLRKHHCRKCGEVVCAECSKQRVAEQYIFLDGKANVSSRVCDSCFDDQLPGGKSTCYSSSSFTAGSYKSVDDQIPFKAGHQCIIAILQYSRQSHHPCMTLHLCRGQSRRQVELSPLLWCAGT